MTLSIQQSLRVWFMNVASFNTVASELFTARLSIIDGDRYSPVEDTGSRRCHSPFGSEYRWYRESFGDSARQAHMLILPIVVANSLGSIEWTFDPAIP